MRYFTLFAFTALSACTRTAMLDHGRWSGSGEVPAIEAQGLTEQSSIQSRGEKVSFSEQKVGSYSVEGTYVKTVSRQGKPVFQSYALIKDNDRGAILRQADRLNSQKDAIWEKFVNQSPDYKSYKVYQSPEVYILSGTELVPSVRVILEKKSGELIEICLSKSGKVLREKQVGSGLDTSQVATLVFPKGPKNSELAQAFVARLTSVEDLKNNLVSVNTEGPAKIANSAPLDIPPTDERFDQTQAFYFASQILKWFSDKKIFQDPLNLKVTTQMGYPEKTNTAFYYQGRIRLGSGDDVTYSRIPWDPSIVMHEVSHAVIERLARLPTEGEGGSLNEGFADFFTSFALANPHMGESSYKPAAYRRTMETVVKMSQKNGGLYHDSVIVSGLFWSLRASLSEDKIINLAVRVLNRLGPDADLKKFQEALVEQSQEIFQGSELEKIQTVMRERELL